LVNGQQVEFVVRHRRDNIALTIEDARRIGIPSTLPASRWWGAAPAGRCAASASPSTAFGRRPEVRTLYGVVLEGLQDSLLGQAYLSRIRRVQDERGGDGSLR
jgi:predicted aspartyl protease